MAPEDGKEADEQLKAGVDALSYALQRRRVQSEGAASEGPNRFKDFVSVTLVVEPNADPSQVIQYTQVFEDILDREQPRRVDPEYDAGEGKASDANDEVETVPEDNHDEVATITAPTLISTCTLKPNKSNPQPTVRNAGGQAAKFISALKPNFLVMANSVPDELHLCMLRELKYHCIIVPRKIQK
ncbi:unnamed protein product [Phytomonas sp. EM1]|nr:unnamed protein product [Phytomonas sp. EM1]|eukprot:CCW60431.1 unnamed protein product [Phytomonas sp. isolate EM1]